MFFSLSLSSFALVAGRLADREPTNHYTYRLLVLLFD